MSTAGGSSSRGGSAAGSDVSINRGGADALNSDSKDLLNEQGQGYQTAVFGTLYTLAKEKVDSAPKWAVLKLALDFIQLFLLIVHPQYGWKINEDLWLWKAISYVNWKNPVIARGYNFYIAIVYVVVVTLFLSVGLCVYVGWSFKTSNFQFVWPLKVLRFYVSVFYQIFFIASLSVFLVALDCRMWGESKDIRGTLAAFPDVKCTAMPHLIHVAVAAISALVFLGMSLAVTIADFEINPLSKRWLASAHSRCELRIWSMKTVMTIIAVLLGAFQKVQSVIILFLAWMLVWSYLRWAPHLNQWVNHVRSGLYGSICWMAFLLVVLSYGPDRWASGLTLALFAGLAPFMGVGFGLSWLRWRYTATRALHRFRNSPPGTKPKRIYKFWDPSEVEVVSRVCRAWDAYDDEVLDKDKVELADQVIRAGMAFFPNNAYMLILYSNFLIDVQNSYQTGYSQLQAAKKANPGWMEKFTIFVREQEHLHKASQGKSGDATVDLISYVEFQRNHRMVIRAHKGALYSVRDFWRHTLNTEVSFTSLSRSLKRISKATTHADKMYRSVLERYPNSSKLFRTYAHYLEDVKNDPWRAAQYYTEADKLEDADDSNNDNQNFTQEGGETDGGMGADQKNNAVIVINAQGIMQMVNKVGYAMFGYKKGEMEGKNVNMLMPPPFNQRHNGYIAKYIATGVPHMLGRTTELIALHAERYVFPVKLTLNKVSGTGPDSVFLGVLQSVEQDPNVVKAWVMPSGQIASLDVRFSDWFGKTPQDLIGKPVSILAVEVDQMARLLEHATVASLKEFEDGKVVMPHTHIIHKYFEPVDTDIGVKLGGSESQRILVYTFKRNQAEDYFMVTDKKGKIRYITSHLALMLGYDSQLIQQGAVNMDTMLPQPFSQLHQSWMKDMPPLPPSNSCRTGAVVCLFTANKVAIPVRIGIITREENDETVYIVTVKKSSYEEGLDERRLKLEIDNQGLVKSVGDSPASLFGFKPQTLVGRSIAEFVDVMRFVGEQAGAEAATTHLLSVLMNRAMERPGLSYRVGVFPPLSEADRLALGSMATTMLAKQTKPAVMAFKVQEMEDQSMQVQLSLWRTDMLTGIIEVDKDGVIQKPGDYPMQTTGLIFGLPDIALTRLKLTKFIHLGDKTVQTLLDKDNAKKGAMKSHTVTTTKLGPVKKMWGTHGDGMDLQLYVQGVTKDGHGKRLFVMVHVRDGRKGNLEFAKLILMQDDILKGLTGSGSHDSGGSRLTAKKKQGPARAIAALEGPEGGDLLGPEIEQGDLKKGGVKFHDDGEDGSEAGGSVDRMDSMEETHEAALEDGEQEEVHAAEENHKEGHEEPEAQDEEPKAMPDKLDRTANWVHSGGNKPEDGAAERIRAKADLDEGTDDDEPVVAKKQEDSQAMKAMKANTKAQQGDGAGDDAASENGGGSEGGSQASGSEGTSQQSGSQIGDSASQAGGDQADYRKGKRYRRLTKLLCGPNAQKSVNRFNMQAIMGVGSLLALHVICFVLVVVLLVGQERKMIELDSAGKGGRFVQKIVMMTRALDNIYKGKVNPEIYDSAKTGWVLDEIYENILDMTPVHHGVFLGFNNLRKLPSQYGLADDWNIPKWATYDLIDTRSPYIDYTKTNLWTLGNQFLSAAREVHQNYKGWIDAGKNISDHREFLYVVSNGRDTLPEAYEGTLYSLSNQAIDNTKKVNNMQMALLVVEGLVLSAIIACYMWFLLQNVANQRYSLFTVFLFIPHGFSRALAAKKVIIEDASDNESDSDAGDLPADKNKQAGEQKDNNGAAGGEAVGTESVKLTVNSFAAGMAKSSTKKTTMKESIKNFLFFWRPAKKERSGRRTLLRNAKDSWWLLAPFMFWSALMITVYAIGYNQLNKAADPVATLNILNFVRYRTMSVMNVAQELCSQETNTGREDMRTALIKKLELLSIDYKIMLYGAIGTSDPRFERIKTGITFTARTHANLMFETRDCLRYQQGTCYDKDHRYYEVTHTGVDAMMLRLIDEAGLLSKDDDVDLSVLSKRLEYMYKVGYFDLHDGLDRDNKLFLDDVIGLYAGVRSLHVVIFVLSWFMGLAFVFMMLRPFAHAQLKESRQIAELLSQLPADLDVEGVLNRTLGARGTGMKDISQEDLDKMNDTRVKQESKSDGNKLSTKSRRDSNSSMNDE